MQERYFKDYSPALGREMECKLYGHAGRPMLYIPCQDGHYYDFENFHMAGTLAPYIEAGELMVLSVDTMDFETWSNKTGDPYWRGQRHEQWMNYLFNEAAPKLQALAMEYNGWDAAPGIIAFGCSLGATHAANLYFRRPDLFDGMIALSGIYTASYGFDGYMDSTVYMNSPVDYLANLPADHPSIEQLNRGRGVICVGQGPWEIPETTFRIKELCAQKGINLWVDAWGYDVAHDWDWWYKQVLYFMPWVLGKQ